MPISDRIKSILEHHEQGSSDYYNPHYWRNLVREKSDKGNSETIFTHLNGRHKDFGAVGDFYRKNGMRIDLADKENDQAQKIDSIMEYIKQGVGDDFKKVAMEQYEDIVGGEDRDGNGGQDKELEKGQVATVQVLGEGGEVKERLYDKEKEVEFFGQIYSKAVKSRSIVSMDSLEETYIKAVAVSILAETDGDDSIAREILQNGGMSVVKSLDRNGLRDLLQDLNALSAQVTNGVEEGKVR